MKNINEELIGKTVESYWHQMNSWNQEEMYVRFTDGMVVCFHIVGVVENNSNYVRVTYGIMEQSTKKEGESDA